MSHGRGPLQLTSKFVSSYTKLLQGHSPHLNSPNDSATQFWTTLLSLDVDHEWLTVRLSQVSKEDFLGSLKPALNTLFLTCLTHARKAPYDDVKKTHSLETLGIIVRSTLSKNPTGWEAMEIMAGGVNDSDTFFMEFVGTIDDLISDANASAHLRHQAMQLGLTFMCAIRQLSPGAYFLRRDIFPSVVSFIKSPETEQYTFEAVLLLSILANFHKSHGAAKLNPYLRRIRETTDEELLRKICWASNFAASAAVRSYQTIVDDSPPTLTKAFGSMMGSLRPDRALAAKPIDPSREIFKSQPIEATVILLPLFEFTHVNLTFRTILLESLSTEKEEGHKSTPSTPLPFTILTLSSYLLTHATSSSDSRAISYANLALHILLQFSKSKEVMNKFCQLSQTIWLCRQRLPILPITAAPRSPICSLIDCCVLWLRHNLHMQLEVFIYITCVQVCFHILQYLQKEHVRLEYDWQAFWRALLGLLDFLSSRLNNLNTTGGVERLSGDVLSLLDLALRKADTFLPSPQSLHEFIYELVRSSSAIKKQASLIEALALPQASQRPRHGVSLSNEPSDVQAHMLSVIDYYESEINKAGAKMAKDAMQIVARTIEREGLRVMKESDTVDEKMESPEGTLGFIRYACTDGLALMP